MLCYRGSHKINAVARVLAVFFGGTTFTTAWIYLLDLLSSRRIYCIDTHEEPENGLCALRQYS